MAMAVWGCCFQDLRCDAQGFMSSGPVWASVFKGPRMWPGVAILMVCVVGWDGQFLVPEAYEQPCIVQILQGAWESISHSVVFNSLQTHGLWPSRLLWPGNYPGKNTGVGCHSLLQGIFLTKGLNPHLLHCRQMFYSLSHRGSLESWKEAAKISTVKGYLGITVAI